MITASIEVASWFIGYYFSLLKECVCFVINFFPKYNEWLVQQIQRVACNALQ